MIKNISSKDNIKIKQLIKLRDDNKYRNDVNLFFVEGEKIIKDAPIELIDEIFILDEYKNKFENIIENFDKNIYIVNENVYNKIKDTKNSQGIIATIKSNILYDISKIDFNEIKKILLLDEIKDPGNLGTIIRVAEATGIDLIILANNCCDIYNTKVIRSTMSSIFRSNIYKSDNIIEDINIIKNNNFSVFATILDEDAINYKKVNFKNKFVLIMGNESNGISNNLIHLSDNNIFIPMKGEIESLNVAISTAVVCYEALNQEKYENR